MLTAPLAAFTLSLNVSFLYELFEVRGATGIFYDTAACFKDSKCNVKMSGSIVHGGPDISFSVIMFFKQVCVQGM